jgi:hypothetical protein
MKIKCPLCAAEIQENKLNQHAGSKRCVMNMKPNATGEDRFNSVPNWRAMANRVGSVSDMFFGSPEGTGEDR